MDLIYQNPFRVLGIHVTATDREIAKQIGDMEIYADMGKTLESESDSFFSVKPDRTARSILEARQKIDHPNNKLYYSLFWFWENSSNLIDEMAFEELKNGKVNKAIEFWERETKNGITDKNKSNYRNLSVLRLGLSIQNGKLNKKHFLNSLSLSGEFFANGHFNDFTSQVLGVRYSVDLLETTKNYVDEIMSVVKPYFGKRKSVSRVTHKEILTHLETYSGSIQKDILDKFVGKYIHNIEKQIKKCGQARKVDVSKANKAGFELYSHIQEDIKKLQLFLPKSDLPYQFAVDKLAEELLQCSIDYFNHSMKFELDPGGDSLKLAMYAKSIVVGVKSRNRIDENYSIIKEYDNDRPARVILGPIISLLNKYQDEVDSASVRANYSLAKEFVYNLKRPLDKVRQLMKNDQHSSRSDYIINVLSACAGFVNSCGVAVANSNSQYGRAIELVDMARRILLYKTNRGLLDSINKDLSDRFVYGRSVLAKNISNADGLLARGLGGLIRTGKRNTVCGCGSGIKLNECCSV
jgi:hypothetical protein